MYLIKKGYIDMKKLVSLLLAILMVFSLASVAFAAEVGTDPSEPVKAAPKKTGLTNKQTNGEENTSGTIVISGLHCNEKGEVDGQYDVYKMLHLESYDAASDAYSYVVIDAWMEFFTTGSGKKYATFNDQGYLVWNTDELEDTVAQFAKDALAYAKSKDTINPVKSSDNDGDFDINNDTKQGTFSELSLGYYLIDSNVGALCGLTTTNPNGLITAKNGAPTIDKQVEEDSAVGSGTNTWFDHNTADIGQYVNFDVTINVHAGAQNYVFHDRMDDGLAFSHEVVNGVQHGLKSIKHKKTVDNSFEDLVEVEDYTLVTTGLENCCTFEIRFTQDFCDSLETNDKIYISYDAKLDDSAFIGEPGNKNEAWLKYGENHETTHDTTTTYTYSFDLVKTDGNHKLIDGAKFKLYTQETGGTALMIVKCGEGVYRHATVVLDGEEDVQNTITVTDGKVTVKGFDNGVYYLEEIEAPKGYNKLEKRIKLTISDGNLSATFVDDAYTPNTGVQVKNSTGSALPETGAMGTTMFIAFGMFVMLGTGILLVTKKRMSMIEE